ncbi:MAG: DUF2304 family protein [Patescibacteria group bacterium]
MMLFQILFLVIVAFSTSRALLRFREKALNLGGVIFWVLVWGVGSVVVFYPGLSSTLANLFGIGRGSDLILYLSVILLFYLIYRIYVKLAGLSRKLDLLIRKLSKP